MSSLQEAKIEQVDLKMPCFLATIDSTGLGKLWKNMNATLQGIYNGSQWVVDRKHAAEQDRRNEQCIRYKGL